MKNKNLYNILNFPEKVFGQNKKAIAKIGLTATMMLSLTAFEAKAQATFSQNPIWAFNGNKLAFTNGEGVNPTVTSALSPTSGIHNSYSSKNGTLIFYIDYNNYMGRPEVYKADGTLIGSLESSNPYYPTIALVPKPGSCNEVYIIYYRDTPGGYLYLTYKTVNTSTWTLSNGPILNPDPTNTNWRFNNGSFVVGKPLANGNHWMYAVTNNAVYKYEISSTGISEANTGNYVPYIGESTTNQVIPFRVGVGQTNKYYIGSHTSTANEIDTRAFEVELSPDGTRLAWGSKDSGKIAYIKLNANGNLEVDPNQFTTTQNYAFVYPVPNISENRINGLEFDSQNSKVIHFTAGKDDATNSRNGINTLNFNPWESNTGNPSLSSVLNSYPYAQSMIELAYNNRFIIGSSTMLRQVVSDQNSNLSLSTQLTNASAPVLNINGINLRTLPNQIDGFNYNFTSYIDGPTIAKVGTQVTYSAPYVAGSTYIWRVNGVIKQSNTSSIFQYTYGIGEIGSYNIGVQVLHSCGNTNYFKPVVIENCDPCSEPGGGGNGRLAQNAATNNSITLSQGPGSISINLPKDQKDYEVYVLDSIGKLVHKANSKGTIELNTNNFTSGLYIIKAVNFMNSNTLIQKFTISK